MKGKYLEKFLIITFLILGNHSISIADEADDTYQSDTPPLLHIIGGNDATIEDWPFIVSIRLVAFGEGSPDHFCGGSLIKKNVVLTAAHCVPPGVTPESLRVFAGSPSLVTPTETSEELEVDRIIRHEGFDARLLRHDIALLILKSGSSQPTVSLTSQRRLDRLNFKSDFKAAGWGFIKNNAARRVGTNLLQEATLTYQNPDVCINIFGPLGFDDNLLLCAGERKKTTCNGDSGGPLVANSNGNVYQVGLVSFGKQFCSTSAGFTSIAAYRQWINNRSNGYLRGISVKDSNLRNCIIDHANRYGWTKEEDVTELNCSSKGIEDLSGLSYLNLQYLNLRDNNISDISVLGKINGLLELDISYNPIYNLTALSNSATLNTISLESLPVECTKSLSYPASFSSFLVACFSAVNIEEIFPDVSMQQCVKSFAKFRKLLIGDNLIYPLGLDVINCNDMPKGFPPIYSIEGIEAFQNLEILFVPDQKIKDVTPLSNLLKLEQLILNNNVIASVAPLENHTALKFLFLADNLISDISPIMDLPVTILSIGGNPILCLRDEDIDPATITNTIGIPSSCAAFNDTDTDGDGVTDSADNCVYARNSRQGDHDGDGVGNRCDSDDDNDGFSDQVELEVGSRPKNALSIPSDIDGDGVENSLDNCPSIFNKNQRDFNGNGIGNKCDDNSAV